ncbi:MAG: methionyl-tRNA formyltransferase [Acidimicrobiales bacterium]
MTPVRLAYLGTPELAVPPLRALVAAGHDVALVVTRPDRRRGRGSATAPSPVKQAAIELGLPVTHDLAALAGTADRDDAAVGVGVELGVVVAYGRLIPATVLHRVPMLNLHFSILPRWRGAAPLERAILAGDDSTGVCVMAVEEGLDTGPVYATRPLPIGPREHLSELRGRLVDAGTRLLVDVLSEGAAHLPDPRPQTGEPTYAAKITAADLELRWDRPATELSGVVRLDRAWTTFRGRRLGVLRAEVVTEPATRSAGAAGSPGRPPDPGTLLGETVVTGDGGLRLTVVQPAGRPPMDAASWLRGAHPVPGERLGVPS